MAALNRMAEGLTVHDAGGRLLFANARVTRVLGGLEITALTDANGDVLRFEDERGAVLPLRALPPFCADLEGGECERTCLMRREGGHHRWIRIRSQRMHDATWGTVMVTLWTDVTRRRARRALAMQREALLSAHRTAAREGILAFSSRGRVLHWNNALLELLRIPESLLEPRAVKPVLLLLESQAREPRQLRMLTRGMARPRDRMAEQIVALRDGRTLGITRAPIREPRGTVHGQAWFFRDVTLELHSAARDRLIELEHAALASSEASRSRYELLARLGHLLGSRELAEAVPDCLRCIASHFGDAAVLDFVDAAGPGVQRRVEVSRSALEPLVPGLEALA
ncbi:MAG: PAS-domain containing protein, partial [Myxococcaceae bacterium]